jgi:hypothetical protein
VEFSETDAYEKALELTNSKLNGSTLTVNASGQPGGASGSGRGGSVNTVFVRGFNKLQDEESVSYISNHDGLDYLRRNSAVIILAPTQSYFRINMVVNLVFFIGMGFHPGTKWFDTTFC